MVSILIQELSALTYPPKKTGSKIGTVWESAYHFWQITKRALTEYVEHDEYDDGGGFWLVYP